VGPLAHNLFFERFLNLERESFPDFDIDFGTDDREVVLDYIFERYGRENVAMICTYSTMHARSAVREVAKALGVGLGEIDAVVKRLPSFVSARGLREAIAGDPARRDLPLDREPFRSILAIAERIAEYPRHLATHPCGVVIAPEPITHIVPLQRGDKGLGIAWDMNAIEDAGLIKIDILGQKGLAVISDTIRQVERNDGLRIDPESVDVLNDPRGRELLRTGRTEGCFYIESPIMLQLLEQAHCDDFEVLTALSSIIRPGVSNYGGKRQYLERHLGLQPVEVLHPRLEPVLRDTYGCLIYQEQVIQVAQAIAGMTLAEADGLRKCMSKKRHWERMETYKERFMTGARRNEVPGGSRWNLPPDQLRRLCVLQGALRIVRARIVRERLLEGALPGRVHGRGAHESGRLLHADGVCRGSAPVGRHALAAVHQPGPEGILGPGSRDPRRLDAGERPRRWQRRIDPRGAPHRRPVRGPGGFRAAHAHHAFGGGITGALRRARCLRAEPPSALVGDRAARRREP
jgi:hypothetical protein